MSRRPRLLAEKGFDLMAVDQVAAYLDGLMVIGDQIGGWIGRTQLDGSLNPALPPVLVPYTLYARACDPVREFLKTGGNYRCANAGFVLHCVTFRALPSFGQWGPFPFWRGLTRLLRLKP